MNVCAQDTEKGTRDVMEQGQGQERRGKSVSAQDFPTPADPSVRRTPGAQDGGVVGDNGGGLWGGWERNEVILTWPRDGGWGRDEEGEEVEPQAYVRPLGYTQTQKISFRNLLFRSTMPDGSLVGMLATEQRRKRGERVRALSGAWCVVVVRGGCRPGEEGVVNGYSAHRKP
ncbi:unnamed protein product [Pleuronectes platessa]|uniref:Uncharacterized protein n=1 Tax=Pleuronectes platessa TaxID=8262 RepID=A0A9N7VPD8_PLEPL|nr:unnamed protein product [Pleuronectes platessa]